MDGKPITFGGGLSILNIDGTWKHFTNEDGLPRERRNSIFPTNVYSGALDKNGVWWFGGESTIFTVNSQRQLNIPKWQKIQKNAILYKPATVPEQSAELVLKGLWDSTSSARPTITSVAATDDGNVWFMIQPFIMRVAGEPTSVKDENQNRNELKVYPNPVSEDITIALPLEFSAKTIKLIFRDITGREIFVKEGDAFKNSYTFSVKEFPVGVYILEVQSGSEVFTKQISVIR